MKNSLNLSSDNVPYIHKIVLRHLCIFNYAKFSVWKKLLMTWVNRFRMVCGFLIIELKGIKRIFLSSCAGNFSRWWGNKKIKWKLHFAILMQLFISFSHCGYEDVVDANGHLRFARMYVIMLERSWAHDERILWIF